jgi:CRISPR-associated endoribonuclease Cas6
MSDAPDLLSLILILRPEPLPAGSERGGWQGRAAHALLLRAIAATDAVLAERLHQGSEARPFTASSLLADRRTGDYALRFTSLTAELSAVLLTACRRGNALQAGATVQLDPGKAGVDPGKAGVNPLNLRLAAVHTQPAEHPAAAMARYADLAAAGLSQAPPRKLALRFLSPTGFRSGGRQQPLPLPELVFGSLLERWNAFAPLAFPADARRYAAECVSISRFDLSSRAIPGKDGGLRIGCVGQVEYTALTYDRYWQGVLSTLAAFAHFAGVGVNTAAGLGQCRAL